MSKLASEGEYWPFSLLSQPGNHILIYLHWDLLWFVLGIMLAKFPKH